MDPLTLVGCLLLLVALTMYLQIRNAMHLQWEFATSITLSVLLWMALLVSVVMQIYSISGK